MDSDKLKREKQVFSGRAKNAEEAWKSMSNEIPSLELKLKLNYNQQYYNNYKSLIMSARKLAGKKNITTLEELSRNEV
ncbi:hypothetical protein MKW92_047891 [Papaver armeniacum]|nr:hypothetical protein MKW92_047891 [Papaver armeniacum]